MSHLRSVHQSCSRHGRTLQFWSNALHDDPEQLWNLPPGVIAMEYGNTVFLVFCCDTHSLRCFQSPLLTEKRNDGSWRRCLPIKSLSVIAARETSVAAPRFYFSGLLLQF